MRVAPTESTKKVSTGRKGKQAKSNTKTAQPPTRHNWYAEYICHASMLAALNSDDLMDLVKMEDGRQAKAKLLQLEAGGKLDKEVVIAVLEMRRRERNVGHAVAHRARKAAEMEYLEARVEAEKQRRTQLRNEHESLKQAFRDKRNDYYVVRDEYLDRGRVLTEEMELPATWPEEVAHL